jgi:hypothetical protein
MQISFIGRLISLLTVVAIAVGVATSAVPRGSTVEPAAAELPFARSRDGVRETYIVSFGLFGPESVFASEAQKAAQILRARLQGEAQVLVRFNDKRDGNATSATLAAALRSAGQAMVPEKDILVVFLTSHGSPDGLAVVAGPRSETLSPRSFRSMLNSSGARYRVVITPRRRRTRPHSAVRTGQPGPILGMRSLIKRSEAPGPWTTPFAGPGTFVARRERREGFEPSEPQMNGGSEVLKLLGGARRETPTVHLERRRSLGKVPVRANQCAPMVPLAVATIQRPPRRTMD